ncbi:MAG: histidinol phosphate phosphatase domain-containing protein, partial [Deltaproteobacteria bacterium]|nr:histidinol phosphate phosphatase domain-containing protein [Deltaproteobacteria bacterium]
VRRARVIGYRSMAITDHVDESNLDTVVKQLIRVCARLSSDRGFRAVPGVELTHIPVAHIPGMVKRARELGAAIVVGHGETIAEPVENGTNLAFIRSRVDVLAHPGLITARECGLAAKNSVCLEITSRGGHSLTNGHVASIAKRCGARLVLNTDSHSPSDLITAEKAEKIVAGAGLAPGDFRRMQKNALELIRNI